MNLQALKTIHLLLASVAMFTAMGYAFAEPIAKPVTSPPHASVAAAIRETQARLPWLASARPYDVNVSLTIAAVLARAQSIEIVMPTYGLVRFDLARVALGSNTPGWMGTSKEGDTLEMLVDPSTSGVFANLTMRDGRDWSIERLLPKQPQHFLLEIDRTKFPRGNDAIPVPQKTPDANPNRSPGAVLPPGPAAPPTSGRSHSRMHTLA